MSCVYLAGCVLGQVIDSHGRREMPEGYSEFLFESRMICTGAIPDGVY